MPPLVRLSSLLKLWAGRLDSSTGRRFIRLGGLYWFDAVVLVLRPLLRLGLRRGQLRHSPRRRACVRMTRQPLAEARARLHRVPQFLGLIATRPQVSGARVVGAELHLARGDGCLRVERAEGAAALRLAPVRAHSWQGDLLIPDHACAMMNEMKVIFIVGRVVPSCPITPARMHTVGACTRAYR